MAPRCRRHGYMGGGGGDTMGGDTGAERGVRRTGARACGRRLFYGPLPARTPEAPALRRPPADVSGGRVGSLQASKSDRLLAARVRSFLRSTTDSLRLFEVFARVVCCLSSQSLLSVLSTQRQ